MPVWRTYTHLFAAVHAALCAHSGPPFPPLLQWDILKMSGIPEEEIAQVGRPLGSPTLPALHA